jgi:hypothetical protein
VYAPVSGERIDKEQPVASALVRIGSRSRQPGGVNVGQLDSDDAQTLVVGRERLSTARDAAVGRGVRREFGHDGAVHG